MRYKGEYIYCVVLPRIALKNQKKIQTLNRNIIRNKKESKLSDSVLDNHIVVGKSWTKDTTADQN